MAQHNNKQTPSRMRPGNGGADMDTQENPFGEVIYAYTRKQAIADGVLVDISKTAVEAGIKYPVAVTQALWAEYIEPDPDMEGWGQSAEGRAWDVLWMFRCRAVGNKDSILHFEVLFLMAGPDKPIQRTVELKAICGPGDVGEPVITIMMPHED
jgi:hypothetical protein